MTKLPRLKVCTVNVYVRNRRLGALRRRLRQINPAVIFAQEAQRLGKIRGYVRFSAPAGIDPDAAEVAVYLRDDIARGFVEFSVVKAHGDAGKPGGVARDRYLARVLFRWAGRTIAAYGLHANAGVMGDGKGPLLDRPASRHNAKLAQRLLDQIVTDEIERHAIPVTGGDWNATKANRGPGTPMWLHTAAAMHYVATGPIDGIGYAPEHFTLTGTGDTPAPGSNHAIGIAVLEVIAS